MFLISHCVAPLIELNLTKDIFFGNLQKKLNCFRIILLTATSKTWTRTLDPDPGKPGLRKTWTLKNLDQKNLDPEKF